MKYCPVTCASAREVVDLGKLPWPGFRICTIFLFLYLLVFLFFLSVSCFLSSYVLLFFSFLVVLSRYFQCICVLSFISSHLLNVFLRISSSSPGLFFFAFLFSLFLFILSFLQVFRQYYSIYSFSYYFRVNPTESWKLCGSLLLRRLWLCELLWVVFCCANSCGCGKTFFTLFRVLFSADVGDVAFTRMRPFIFYRRCPYHC